ncbi:TRAP transporter small permease [Roseibium sp.]|uniref:TRAP transporter small permease n=1 Tax=Roseibium sp. TaxID=1936156 RepID=UPI003D1032B2
MGALLAVLKPLAFVNSHLLRIGRGIGVVAVALMVVAILIQVVARYGFNNALPWPDEAARFCMLWMTGLMAPTAFRRGGFVAIDTLVIMLPKILASVLSLFLLCVSFVVLIVAVQIGYAEVTGFGGKFATASLYVPGNLALTEWIRVPRSWMMMSMFVGVILLALVNVELILRSLISLIGGKDDLPGIPDIDMAGAD